MSQMNYLDARLPAERICRLVVAPLPELTRFVLSPIQLEILPSRSIAKRGHRILPEPSLLEEV